MSNKLNETSGYEIAGLIVDLMSKIRKGVISILELKKFLTMKSSERRKIFGIPILEEYPKMKLVTQGIEIPELAKEINFQQHFTENKEVKYWLGDNFKKHTLAPAKVVSSLPSISFDKHKFTETIYDKEIMEHFQISESAGLMTREEILWSIASLTAKQLNGEKGVLINDDYATLIGYMLCDDGFVRVVSVRWSSGHGRWHCHCDALGIWFAAYGLLSRN